LSSLLSSAVSNVGLPLASRFWLASARFFSDLCFAISLRSSSSDGPEMVTPLINALDFFLNSPVLIAPSIML